MNKEIKIAELSLNLVKHCMNNKTKQKEVNPASEPLSQAFISVSFPFILFSLSVSGLVTSPINGRIFSVSLFCGITDFQGRLRSK